MFFISYYSLLKLSYNHRMFDEQSFTNWLNQEAEKAMQRVTSGESLKTEEIIILTLKAQTNHIAHLEQDLRGDILALRQDMDKRFEQVNKRFEQVDKRLEQMEKRFEIFSGRMDSFMRWSFSTTVMVGGLVVAAIKLI